jgi:lactate permease
MYLNSDPLLTAGSVILGLHEALTPLSIMAGAITLFESMEATYCLPYMMREIKTLTAGHPIAEAQLYVPVSLMQKCRRLSSSFLMCVFFAFSCPSFSIFCFAYMVEGASGFGTPAALGAPMLVSFGHPALESVVILLIFNTFATVWGAVGTPIWFGFGASLDELTEDDFLAISQKAAVCLAISGFILIPFVLTILVPWKVVRANLLFVMLSLVTCIGPSAAIAFVSYEFPSLIGGMIGCVGTAALIHFHVGLSNYEVNHETKNATGEQNSATTGNPDDDEIAEDALENVELGNEENAEETNIVESTPAEIAEEALGPRKSMSEGYLSELLLRTFPIWGVVLLLVLTRVEQIGIKDQLIKRDPFFSIHFGTYGTFRLSSSVVFQLRDILGYPGLSWKYELLYVPFLLPFVLVSALILFIYRKNLATQPKEIASAVATRLRNPAIALFGALVLVQLLIKSGESAPANLLGTILSDWFKEAFVILTPLLGALGSFFSGSTTVSNLTFADIQFIAADSIGTSRTSILALQAVGASAGNGICLNNIIAACAVVGLNIGEGKILMQTYKFVFASTTICTIVILSFYARFDS